MTDIIEESAIDGLGDVLGKSKYTKRTGTPGNYKYEYGDDKGKPTKGIKAPEGYAEKDPGDQAGIAYSLLRGAGGTDPDKFRQTAKALGAKVLKEKEAQFINDSPETQFFVELPDGSKNHFVPEPKSVLKRNPGRSPYHMVKVWPATKGKWVKKSEEPMNAIDNLGKILSKSDGTGAAKGGKYKYRKFVNGKWQYQYEDHGPKNPTQEKEHAKYQEAHEKHDPHMTHDLDLVADNTQHLSNQKDSIHKNLINKMASGNYDHHQARKLWQYHADATSKHYEKEFGRGSGGTLHDRRQMAHENADNFLEDHDSGEHDEHLHKKYQVKDKVKKSEDSMDSINTTEAMDFNQLSKGMHSFYDADKKAARMPDTYLLDLVDAFIQEAHDCLKTQPAYNEMNLVGQDKASQLCKGVFSELVRAAQFNQNIKKAMTLHKITEPWVKSRMVELGYVQIKDENYQADQDAQVAGFHPKAMALSQSSMDLKVDHVGSRSVLQKSEEKTVNLPSEHYSASLALNQYHQALNERLRPSELAKANVDPECLIHGRELEKANTSNPFAKCSCPK